MTLEPNDAAASLSEIASIERRTRRSIVYARSSTSFILWGVLLALGYLVGHVDPPHSGTAWIALVAIGFAATTAIAWRRPTATHGRWDRPMLYAQFVVYAYGWVIAVLAWPLTPRQLDAFWPTVFMLGFVLAGLWLGRFFVILGVAVTALTLAGFFWAGDLFRLWMAVVGGGGLIAGGLWLRRVGDSA
jgi:hypothetical protein